MRVIKHTETELVFHSGLVTGWIGAGITALFAVLWAWDASLSGWETQAVCGVVFLGVVALCVLLTNSTETYTVDKTTDYLTTETRTAWKKLSQTGQYPIRDIAVVVLNQDKQGQYSLALRNRSGETAPLRSGRQGNLLEVAELMSTFLRVPLLYTIPDSRHPLRSAATTIVLPVQCAGCNAPLPSIDQGTDAITCDRCGTTMAVRWDPEGLPTLAKVADD